MPKKPLLKLNNKGFHAIRTSEPVWEILTDIAEELKEKAETATGEKVDGYTVTQLRAEKPRAAVSVQTRRAAVAHDRENHILINTIGKVTKRG